MAVGTSLRSKLGRRQLGRPDRVGWATVRRAGAAVATLTLFAAGTVLGPAAVGVTTAERSTAAEAAATSPCTATWQDTRVPDNGSRDQVLNDVAGTSSSDLYAVGRYYDQGIGTYTARALRNTGSGWSELSLPSLNGFAELRDASSSGPAAAWFGGFESDPSRVYVPVLLRAVGSTVTRVALPAPPASTNELDSDEALPVDIPNGGEPWVAATYYAADYSGTKSVLYRHQSGGTWTQTLLPMQAVDAVDALSATSGYLGGEGLYSYDHGTVTKVDALGMPHWVWSISSLSASDVWVLGENDGGTPVLMHFDGNTWVSVPLDAPGAGGPASGGTVRVAPNGVVWLLGVVPDRGYYQSWTARFDPSTGTWASIVTSIGGQTPEDGFGQVSGLLTLSGSQIYAAGWLWGQRPGFVGKLCQLTAGQNSLTPSAVRLNRLGDGLIVTAGQAIMSQVTVQDLTGSSSTGKLSPTQGGALRFFSAGTYAVRAQPPGSSATVSVPVRILAGDPSGRAVTVYVATKVPPAGYAYRLQVRKPGTTSWRSVGLDSLYGGTSRSFYPTRWPSGTYSVRAKLVNTSAGTSTAWSPVAQFQMPAAN